MSNQLVRLLFDSGDGHSLGVTTMSRKKLMPYVELRDEDRRVVQAALDAINLTKLEAGDQNYLGIREDFTIYRIPPWALSREFLRLAK